MARIVIVGDVHGFWNTTLDNKALKFLKPDLVLFVGDFDNQDARLVQEVSETLSDMRKAVMLGNHDCWWDGLSQAQAEEQRLRLPAYRLPGDVKDQLTALGDTNVGYKRIDFPEYKLSVVGSRPFSDGGSKIFNLPLIKHLYGISNMKASAERITSLALAAPKDHSLIFLGHNGPSGLGSQPEDICGIDFERDGCGDHGDPDLEAALEACASRKIPLVTFGHMHDDIARYPGHKRDMLVVGDNDTIYVNTAVVPRVVGRQRNFTVVDLFPNSNKVAKVTQTWVSVEDEDKDAKLSTEKIMYQAKE